MIRFALDESGPLEKLYRLDLAEGLWYWIAYLTEDGWIRTRSPSGRKEPPPAFQEITEGKAQLLLFTSMTSDEAFQKHQRIQMLVGKPTETELQSIKDRFSPLRRKRQSHE